MLIKLSLIGIAVFLIWLFVVLFPFSMVALLVISVIGLVLSGLIKMADALFPRQ